MGLMSHHNSNIHSLRRNHEMRLFDLEECVKDLHKRLTALEQHVANQDSINSMILSEIDDRLVAIETILNI